MALNRFGREWSKSGVRGELGKKIVNDGTIMRVEHGDVRVVPPSGL